MELFSIKPSIARNFSRSLMWIKARRLQLIWLQIFTLSAYEKGKLIYQTKYRGIIGSLLYLTASKPNIMHSVCMCAHYQSCPKESHFSAVKRVMNYLRGTLYVGLWYPKGVEIALVGCSDSDIVGCKLDRKQVILITY